MLQLMITNGNFAQKGILIGLNSENNSSQFNTMAMSEHISCKQN